MAMKQNTADLQALLEQANALPEFVDTTDATATAGDMLSGKTAYADGKKITGTIATKTASSLTASGATVTVPAGYYATQATKSVATATQATPSISIDANGKITATATQNAGGYIAPGSKTATKQMTTKAATTITPTKSSQTAVDKNVYTTGAVTVAPIPDQYADISVTTIPSKNHVPEGEIYVDADGVTQTGVFSVDHVIISHADGGESISAKLDDSFESSGFIRVDGAQLGNARYEHVLEGVTFTGWGGSVVNKPGTMPNNGDTSQTIDGLETKSATIPAGYTTGGTVTVDDTVDNIANTQATTIAEISALLEGKSVEGGVNIETCNVRIYNTDGAVNFHAVFYNALINNAIQTQCYELGTSNTFDFTLENVICGSTLTIRANSAYSVSANIEYAEELAKIGGVCLVFEITASAGGITTIKLYDND